MKTSTKLEVYYADSMANVMFWDQGKFYNGGSDYHKVDECELLVDVRPEDVDAFLETVYCTFQNLDRVTRSSQLGIRSMSVGDVVVLDGYPYGVANCGFKEIVGKAPAEMRGF